MQARLTGAGITFTAAGHGEARRGGVEHKKDKDGKTIDNPDGRAKNRRVAISFAA